MIYISGMEGGSGCGEAASRKAGWLRGGVPGGAVLRSAAQSAAAQLLDALNTALANRSRGYANPPPPPVSSPTGSRSSAPAESRPRRPEFTPDGRPLPPDGSAPPPRVTARRQHAASGAASSAPARAGQAPSARPPAEFDQAGHPLPPDGSVPSPRPDPSPGGAPAAAARRTSRSAAGPGAAMPPARVERAPGAPVTSGGAPSAPMGHRFVSRPVPAPPGEFLFDVRCSCGASAQAPVKLDDLRRAAERGLPPAAAIAIATQDALDRMHAAP
jgi:hypothetical protein